MICLNISANLILDCAHNEMGNLIRNVVRKLRNNDICLVELEYRPYLSRDERQVRKRIRGIRGIIGQIRRCVERFLWWSQAKYFPPSI